MSYIEVSLLLSFVRKNVAAHEIRHVTLLHVIGNYLLFHLTWAHFLEVLADYSFMVK